MKKLWIIIALSGLSQAQNALAGNLRCEASQKFCMVENKRLVIGDEVVFVNEDNEIVARGDVSDMNGRDRKIDITKRYGMITQDCSVRRSNDNDRNSLDMATFETYRAPGKIAAGASLGMTPMNIASDAMAYSIEGFGQYRSFQGLLLTGRAHIFNVSGTVDTGENGTPSSDYSANGLVALGGIGYKLFPKSPIAVKPMLEAGFAYTSVDVSGSQNIRSLDRLGNGFGMAGRIGADAMYTRLGDWQPLVGAGFSIINQARATTISAGIMKELK